MLSSLARYLEPLPDEEGDAFLIQIQALFQSDFIARQKTPDHEDGESLNMSSRPVDSDITELISEEMPQEEGRDSDSDSGRALDSSIRTSDKTSESNSSMVLHLGSVLSPEHDYLQIWLYSFSIFTLMYVRELWWSFVSVLSTFKSVHLKKFEYCTFIFWEREHLI